MTATILSDDTIETRYYQRYIALENAAPILLARNYSYGGKEFLPEFARAKWTHGTAIKSIELSGPVLNKGGRPGDRRASIDYVTPAHHGWDTQWNTNAPAWLLELFGIEVPA